MSSAANGTSRKKAFEVQRALYACRGGMTDQFLKTRLGIKPEELHNGLGPAFVELNKRTHVRPDTELTTEAEIEEFADNALAALDDLFETIDELKERAASALIQALSGAATSAFINQSIARLDEISGTYETGGVLIDDPDIISLDADKICCRFTGMVSVALIAGGKRDGVVLNESFPFECTTLAQADEPENFDPDETQVEVDVSSWTAQEE
jgi:hypothetical protein